MLLFVTLWLVLVILITGCDTTVEVSAAERDKAIIFYSKLYPITIELKQVNDDLNNHRIHVLRITSEDVKIEIDNRKNIVEILKIMPAKKRKVSKGEDDRGGGNVEE